MMANVSTLKKDGIPDEPIWKGFPIHRNVAEWAGYTQIFHCDDPALGKTPWHEIDWTHAGGADSFFQAKWPAEKKVRPPWEVLHLGPAGENWLGRTSTLLDGTVPEKQQANKAAIKELWRSRREREATLPASDRGERIKPTD